MASNSIKFTTDFIKIIPDIHELIHAGGETWSPLYALLIQIMHWEISYRSKGTQIMTLLKSHNSLNLNPGLIYWTIHLPFESNKLLNYHCKNGLPFYCEEEWHTLSDTKHIVRTFFFSHLNLSHSNISCRIQTLVHCNCNAASVWWVQSLLTPVWHHHTLCLHTHFIQ
jgi:hypothetical protein